MQHAGTAFMRGDQSPVVAEVVRGRSVRPLEVTAAGMNLQIDTACVGRMARRH